MKITEDTLFPRYTPLSPNTTSAEPNLSAQEPKIQILMKDQAPETKDQAPETIFAQIIYLQKKRRPEKPPGTYQSQISEEEASSSLEMHKKGKFTPFDLN